MIFGWDFGFKCMKELRDWGCWNTVHVFYIWKGHEFGGSEVMTDDCTHGHHHIFNIKTRLIMFFADKDGEAQYSQQKQDLELIVAHIMSSLLQKFRLKLKKIRKTTRSFHFTSVKFSRSVVSNSLWPHESQHARSPCLSPTSGVYPNSCPLSRWCHPAISSSVIPFSSCPQSLPAWGSFPMSQLFAWGG